MNHRRIAHVTLELGYAIHLILAQDQQRWPPETQVGETGTNHQTSVRSHFGLVYWDLGLSAGEFLLIIVREMPVRERPRMNNFMSCTSRIHTIIILLELVDDDPESRWILAPRLTKILRRTVRDQDPPLTEATCTVEV